MNTYWLTFNVVDVTDLDEAVADAAQAVDALTIVHRAVGRRLAWGTAKVGRIEIDFQGLNDYEARATARAAYTAAQRLGRMVDAVRLRVITEGRRYYRPVDLKDPPTDPMVLSLSPFD